MVDVQGIFLIRVEKGTEIDILNGKEETHSKEGLRRNGGRKNLPPFKIIPTKEEKEKGHGHDRGRTCTCPDTLD